MVFDCEELEGVNHRRWWGWYYGVQYSHTPPSRNVADFVVKFNVPKFFFYELPVYSLKENYFNCTKPTSTQSDLSESQIFITGLVTFCLKLGAWQIFMHRNVFSSPKS